MPRLLKFEVALRAWKSEPKGEPPKKPEPPPTPRLVVADTTIAALTSVLEGNPRGILLARDELAAWFGSFDRHSNRKRVGGDSAHWVSLHDGEELIVDRRTGQPLIVVPHASVWIAGGVQPKILAKATRGELRDSGLLARFLFAFPPPRPKHWSDDCVPPELVSGIENIYDELRSLKTQAGPDGSPEPVPVRLTREALEMFKIFVNEHGQEQAELSGDLASFWSKLEESAARLALVHYLTRWAGGDLSANDALDEESMKAGLTLSRWFGREARRVVSMLDESTEEQAQRRLVDWIARRGGFATVREVQRAHQKFRTSVDAEEALNKLEQLRLGHWQYDPTTAKGGRPTSKFHLWTA